MLAIHIQYCWYLRYWIFLHPILKQLSFLHLLPICFENSQSDWKYVEKMLCAALWNSCVQFREYAPLKGATFFGPLDIHVIQDKFRSTWVLQNFFFVVCHMLTRWCLLTSSQCLSCSCNSDCQIPAPNYPTCQQSPSFLDDIYPLNVLLNANPIYRYIRENCYQPALSLLLSKT